VMGGDPRERGIRHIIERGGKKKTHALKKGVNKRSQEVNGYKVRHDPGKVVSGGEGNFPKKKYKAHHES